MTLHPICFMVMPFGTKETGINDGTAPTKVDFDALWEHVFSPVLKELGYEPVRADCDIDALIIKDMMERLTLSDLIVADLSINNGNVYYEIGVRHAARESDCVIVSTEWAKPLFDLGQSRRLTYPLAASSPSDDEIVTLKQTLKEKIPLIAKGRSPVHECVIGYPTKIDAASATSFRDFVTALSAFQSKINAVRVINNAAKKEKIEELISEYLPKQGQMMFSVAYELLLLVRDYIGWERTVEYIDALSESLKALPLVKEQYYLALSKTGDHANSIGALETLVKEVGDSAERQGLLGGRYKKLYRSATDLTEKRKHLNNAIIHYSRGMMLDLNDYYCACNLPRLLKERNTVGDQEKAIRVATLVILSCERAKGLNASDEWLNPTLLGAAFDAADLVKAQELAEKIHDEGIHVWKLESTMEDIEHSVARMAAGDREGFEKIVLSLKKLLRNI